MKHRFPKIAFTIALTLLIIETAIASTQAEQLQDFWIEFRAATQSERDYPKLEKLIQFPLQLGGNLESSRITNVKKSNFVIYVKPVLAVDAFDPGKTDGEKLTIRSLMDRYPDIRQYRHVKQRIRQDGTVISPVKFGQLLFYYIKGKWYWKEGYLPEDWCLTESKVSCPK